MDQASDIPSKVPKLTTMSSVKKGRRKHLAGRRVKPSLPCPKSDGCARTSIDGWEWHKWSRNALPSDRARVRGIRVQTSCFASMSNASQSSNVKGPSARTNRVKLRNLLAAAEGADLLKVTQLTVTEMSFGSGNFLSLHIYFFAYHSISSSGKEKTIALSKEQDT